MAAGAGGFVWSERSACTHHRTRYTPGPRGTDREARTHTHTHTYITAVYVTHRDANRRRRGRSRRASSAPGRSRHSRPHTAPIDRARTHPHHTTQRRECTLFHVSLNPKPSGSVLTPREGASKLVERDLSSASSFSSRRSNDLSTLPWSRSRRIPATRCSKCLARISFSRSAQAHEYGEHTRRQMSAELGAEERGR